MSYLNVKDVENMIEALKIGYLEHKKTEYMETYVKILEIAVKEREKLKIKVETKEEE